MASHDHAITLTIASGGTSIEYIDRKMSQAVAAVLYCPATLPETVTVYVAAKAASAPTYVKLQNSGADITGAAGKAIPFPAGAPGAFEAIKLLAGGAVAADRTFTLVLVIEGD